jgi:hypothetical protein
MRLVTAIALTRVGVLREPRSLVELSGVLTPSSHKL